MKKIIISIIISILFFTNKIYSQNLNISSNLDQVRKSETKYIGKPLNLLLKEMDTIIGSYLIGSIEGNSNFIIINFEKSEKIIEKRNMNIKYSGMNVYFETNNDEINNIFEKYYYNKQRHNFDKNSLNEFKNFKIIAIDRY